MSEESPAEVIFFAALEEATPAKRVAYLDEACAGNEPLRRRVEALLAAHLQVGQFLERPVVEAESVAALGGSDGSAADLSFLAPPSEPGSLGRLDHYEILEVVGRGGMGVVLRARDTKLERVVAIKVLAAPLAASGSARRRFAREARAAAAVRDEHVIDIHAVRDGGPVPYLVMEFIDGCNLEALLRRGGPLGVQEVLRIGIQVASGLAAAHKHGLVHRDVKPANILLENGVQRVKLTDFGLARAADDASLTQSGVVSGTPEYMSPEQANGEHVEHRSDLFSLGSVLYTLCAGHPPFRANSMPAVLKRVCEETSRPLREVNRDVPDWLAAIIARLHAKSPAERYQSAAEVAELFGRCLTHLQQPGVKPSDPPAFVTVRRTRRRGGSGAASCARRLAACAALIGVGCVALCWWIFWRPHEAKTPNGANGTAQEVPAWKPPPLTPEELAKRPSPLDALQREAMDLPRDAPPELLALLGKSPSLRLDGDWACHWMAQTRDGRLLAVPHGCDVQLFDADTGLLLRTLTGHTSRAYRPAFSPDGKRLASGEDASLIRVWDVATGREELTLKGHTQPVWCVAFDPEGRRLVSADAGGTVKVWNAEGQVVASFQGHTQAINQLAFSPDRKRLATVSLDGTCKVWDPDNWQEVRSLPGNDRPPFEAVAWSPDGKLLAAGYDARVIVWNVDTYDVLHTLETPGKGLLAFAPDGRTLFTARHGCSQGERHAFTRWDVATGDQEGTYELPSRGGGCVFFQLSPDGRTLFVAQVDPVDPQLRAYDAETGWERFHRGHRSTVIAVAVSPDRRLLASGGSDHTVRLWNLAGWRPGEPSPPVRVLEGHTNEVWSVAFSPDGKLLASGGNEGVIRLWDVASGRKVRDLTGHSPACAYLAFSPDGRTIAAGGKKGTVNRWDVDTGQRKEPWPCHAGPVRPVAYSPDGRLLASGGSDATVQLLDAATGQQVQTFRGNTFFTNVAFSPDGRTLAAVNEGPDATFRLWDLETKAERALTGHTGHILGLAFHPGGKLVATASWDGTVRLWDVTPESRAVRTFDFRSARLAYCATFTPEGRHLIAGLDDGTIAILRVPALPAGPIGTAREGPAWKPPPPLTQKELEALPSPLGQLDCAHTCVADLSPLKGMKLKSLSCDQTLVSDLSPLRGMDLEELSVAHCRQVTDLAPLRGMPLQRLWWAGTAVSDLSPLKGMPLKEILCDFQRERDAEFLRSLKTLETVNGKSAAEFWKEVDCK
jgi:WD40 repeat protein